MTRAWIARLRSQEGVSLVEVMVGLVVMSVVLLGLAATLAVAAQRMHVSREHLGRWTTSLQQVERLRAMPYEQLADGKLAVEGAQMDWSVTEIYSGHKEIRVFLRYDDPAGRALGDTIVVRRTAVPER